MIHKLTFSFLGVAVAVQWMILGLSDLSEVRGLTECFQTHFGRLFRRSDMWGGNHDSNKIFTVGGNKWQGTFQNSDA